MDVIEESVELAMLQFIDQPISNALITAILASVNAFLRTLIQRGALVAGSASYDPAENPPSQISAGQLVFDIDVMPPPPAERLTFQTFIDVSLLQQLGSDQCLDHIGRSNRIVTSKNYRGNQMNIQINSLDQRQRLYRWRWLARARRRGRDPAAAPSHDRLQRTGNGGTAELWSGVDKLEAQDKVVIVRCRDPNDGGEPLPDSFVPGAREPRAIHQPGTFG